MDFHRNSAETTPAKPLRPALRQVAGLTAAIAICNALGIGLLTSAAAARAAEPQQARATSSRAAREEAIQAIPFDKLSRAMRGRVAAVINNTSVYRRLPVQSINCDPDLFVFLLRNPEVVVDIWRVMGITNMTLDRSGPDRYRAADGQGTTGTVDFAYRSNDLHVIYSEGMYDGPMYPTKLRGQCVIVLKTAFTPAMPTAGCMSRIGSTPSCAIENLGAEIVAKTLQPLLGRTADHNFSETSTFVGSLAHTAETNPNGVGRLAKRLGHVEPQIRQQFADLADAAADNAAAAEALAESPPAKPTPANPATARTRPSGTAEARDR